ncbi:MAG: C25 family cysteine peptidase [Candidatus Rifleibacteriota bacterium]
MFKIRNYFILFLALCIVGLPIVAQAQIRVDSDRSLEADVHVTVPELGKVNFSVENQDFVGLFMKHSRLLVDKGKPALPVMTGLAMISTDGKPKLTIVETKFEEIQLNRAVVPSRGIIPRNVDPRKVPFKKGKVYKQNRWFPSTREIVKISNPFIFREVRGLRLQVAPVQYNPVSGKLRVYSYIRAKIQYDGKGGPNVHRGRTDLTRAYAPIYRKAFLNFATVPKRLSPVNENGRLIILAADDFVNAVAPLATWKKKCGIKTILVSASQIGGATEDNIKNFLRQQFKEAGFSHVILVGDAEQIPPCKGENEGADSDPVYVKLAGDDHVPDAIISRISAATPEKVSYQVAKIINYEQYPSEGEDAGWYTRTLGIASNEGNPTDFERMDELKEALLNAGRYKDFSTVYAPVHSSGGSGGYNGYPYPGNSYPGNNTDYDGMGGFNSPNPHYPMPGDSMPPMYSVDRSRNRSGSLKDQVFESVNSGVSLINYIGHGSSSKWVTSGFSSSDCKKLTNGLMLPVILSVACVNGDFVGKDSFCEAWMNAGSIDQPRGAVAIFGSTTNQSWVPPCKVQTEIVTDFIINDSYITVGGLMTNGIIKGLEIYGVETHSEGVKMMEQWHLFGDGTTMMRSRAPYRPVAKFKTESIEGESQVIAQVLDKNGKPVKDARVTCYSPDMELMATSLVNDKGLARVNIGLVKGQSAYVTVIGPDMVPIVDKEIKF